MELLQHSVAGTAVGSVPHQIDLKVTQLPGGQLSEVTGFIVGPEDVVQVKQGENLIVSTSSDLTTHQVTVRNIQGIPIDLVPLPSNAWSLQGLLPGVYTLNVNVAQQNRINWGAICRNPIVDSFISEPCETLTSPDGFTLTPQGGQVLRCVGVGAVATLLAPEILASVRSLGPAVGCGSTVGVEPSPLGQGNPLDTMLGGLFRK